LVAEHGAAVRPPGSKEWTSMDAHIDFGWKELVRPILQAYEDATPGSFVEEKRTSLVWHYRRVDPEFGTWKAHQLVDSLGAVTASAPIVVRHGHKIVEIVPNQITKGNAARAILEELPDEQRPDVVLCAGDDATDESLFALPLPDLLSFKVGPGPTAARYRLRDPSALRAFLLDALQA
jgi:trehalose 6-phosphate synthase/phosphatase